MDTSHDVVAVSSYGPSGASTRVRMVDWFDHVGVNVSWHNYIGTADNQPRTLLPRWREVMCAERSLRKLPSSLSERVLMMSRQASPFSSGKLEERLLRAADRSVYDFDDTLLNDVDHPFRRVWSKKALWQRSVGAADVVIAGSNILANEASDYSHNVVMVPSCIEPASYLPKQTYELTPIPRAVWIGSPGTEMFLTALSVPLLRLNRTAGLRLSVISAGHSSLGVLDSMVDRYQWSLDTYARQLSSADFGIMPLPDTPYTRGKCAYKILQYAATALPVVASPVGSNIEVMGMIGALSASSGDEWYEAISELLQMSSRQRKNLGKNALHEVKKNFSFDSWEAVWLSALGLQNPSTGDTRSGGD